jgi:hypothetical protein
MSQAVDHIHIPTRQSQSPKSNLSPLRTSASFSPKSPLSPRLAVDEVDVTTANMAQKLSISHQHHKQQLSPSSATAPQTPPRSPSSNHRVTFSFENKSPNASSPLAKKKLEFWELEHEHDLESKKRIKITVDDEHQNAIPLDNLKPTKPIINVESLIPRFYFPTTNKPNDTDLKQDMLKISGYFLKNYGGFTLEQFKVVTTEVCKLPYFLNSTLFRHIDRNQTGRITREQFEQYVAFQN